MWSIRPIHVAICFSASSFLAGCQSINTAPKAPVTPTVEAPQVDNQFQLNGKIGVRTPQQSGSAFFTWIQDGDNFDLELTGILGIGKTMISGTADGVTLNSSKTGLIEANSPEELLQRATGWQAPITHLVDWVQARPADTNATTQKDAAGRIIQIIEDGWTVDLSYVDQATLPNRLVLKQRLANDAENRITMLIQNR